MNPILSIIEELQEAKGSLAKKAILTREKANVELTAYLYMVYEPTVNYYMLQLPGDVVSGDLDAVSSARTLEVLKQIYESLGNRKVTGHAAKKYLKDMALYLDYDGQELLNFMILRDIKAGVGPGTLNSIWPGFLTIIPYMRCVLPKDSKIKEWGWGNPNFHAYSQIKADGMFGVIEYTPGTEDVTIFSRAGSRWPITKHFEPLVAAVRKCARGNCDNGPVQFHGELLIFKDGKVMPRQEGNGVFNSILQTGAEIPANMEVRYVVWDMVNSSEAQPKAKGTTVYTARLARLNNALVNVMELVPDQHVFRLIETRTITTYQEAITHLLEALGRGEEGTVIKAANGVWLDGDNKFQVKGKMEFVVDLRIKGFKAGDANGKHAKTFGSIEAETDDGLLEVSVSGMTDALRKLIHENREAFLGRIMAVTANNIMYSTNGGKTPHSLFLPRLLEIREDKKTADTFAQVMAALEAAKSGGGL